MSTDVRNSVDVCRKRVSRRECLGRGTLSSTLSRFPLFIRLSVCYRLLGYYYIYKYLLISMVIKAKGFIRVAITEVFGGCTLHLVHC